MKRLIEKLKAILMSKKEVARMREILLNKAKPLFMNYAKKVDSSNLIKIKELYDDRINTLPNEEIMKLYNEYKADKTNFVVYMMTLYSSNRWLRRKLAGY